MLKLHLLKCFNLFIETEILRSCLRLASQAYLTPKSMILTISPCWTDHLINYGHWTHSITSVYNCPPDKVENEIFIKGYPGNDVSWVLENR